MQLTGVEQLFEDTLIIAILSTDDSQKVKTRTLLKDITANDVECTQNQLFCSAGFIVSAPIQCCNHNTQVQMVTRKMRSPTDMPTHASFDLLTSGSVHA